MLLDLLIAKERGQKLSVTAVTTGSGSASTTALRYVSTMEKMGLIERVPDGNDARRSWLRLSTKGDSMMKAFFDQASPI